MATCETCGTNVSRLARWCKPCFDARHNKPPSTCVDCSRPLSHSAALRCKACEGKSRRVSNLCAAGCGAQVSARGNTCRPCWLAAHPRKTPKPIKAKPATPSGAGLMYIPHRRRAYTPPKIEPVKVRERLTTWVHRCPRCGREYRSARACAVCLLDGVTVSTIAREVRIYGEGDPGRIEPGRVA